MSNKILITTSRRPRPRSRSLVKDLVSVIPNAVRYTRGHTSYEDLARIAIGIQASRVIIISERKGNPGLIRAYIPTTNPLSLKNIVTFIVRGVKLSREAGTRTRIQSKMLYVVSDGSPLSDEFAEAFMLAFNAKLLVGEPSESFVLAKLVTISDNVCLLKFLVGDRQVGPELKLSKPRSMIKSVNSITHES